MKLRWLQPIRVYRDWDDNPETPGENYIYTEYPGARPILQFKNEDGKWVDLPITIQKKEMWK